MTTNNPNDCVNPIPFLSQEMERTLRRLAWKDEDFREALLADPKGVIQQVFPHCFPDGKLPDDLIVRVVEQDPFTRHIVLPVLADEEPTLEIPEEEQLDLIVNLGSIDRKRSRDNDESQPLKKSADQRKRSFTEADAKRRDQAKQQDAKPPREQEIVKALSEALKQDQEVYQAVKQALRTDGSLKNEDLQMMKKKGYLPEGISSIRLSQNTDKKWTIVISRSGDASEKPGVYEKELLERIDNRDIHRNLIQTNTCRGGVCGVSIHLC